MTTLVGGDIVPGNEIDTILDSSEDDHSFSDLPPVGSQPAGGFLLLADGTYADPDAQPFALPSSNQPKALERTVVGQRSNGAYIYAYPDIVNAVYYVLDEFVDWKDCNAADLWHDDKAPEPLNPKEKIARVRNAWQARREAIAEGQDVKNARSMPHLRVVNHEDILYYLNRWTHLYYRSRYGAKRRIGYGLGSRCLKLTWCQVLGITQPKQYLDEYVMLMGGDVDAHDGETDARQVLDWIVSVFGEEYVYYEPSTNGKGWHFYIKLAFAVPEGQTLDKVYRQIREVMRQLSRGLSDQVRSLGYQAKLDTFKGLPLLFDCDPTVGDLSAEDIYHAPVLKLPRFSSFVSSSDSFSASSSNSCSSSVASSPSVVPSMESVRSFMSCSYLSLDALAQIVARYCPQLIKRDKPSTANHSGTGDTTDHALALPSVADHKGASPLNEEEEEVKDTRMSAYSASNMADQCSQWTPDKCPDASKRTYNLCALLTRQRGGQVPELHEAIEIYKRYDLNTGEDDTERRIERFKETLASIKATYQPKKHGHRYAGYDSVKEPLLQVLSERTKDLDLTYKVWRGKCKTLTLDELAWAYWATKIEQGDADRVEFGYAYLIQAFKGNGRLCNRWLACKLFKVLQEVRAIEMTDEYHWSRKGGAERKARRWQVNDILAA